MSQAKITLIGLENYLNPDQSLFDKMTLPEDIDKDTLIGSILMRCQEFELLYSDPYFMQDAISIWSRKNYRTFDKWVKALNIEYDPLYNYDRTEEYTDTHSGSFNNSRNESGTNGNTRTDNLSQSDDHTRTDNLTMTNNLSDTNDVTLTHSEKAYNDSNYVGTTQDVTDQDESHTGTVTNTGTQRTAGTTTNTGTVTDSGNFSSNAGANGTDNYTDIHNARLFGNIGVTTSQQMLQSELDIAHWNLYEHIADLFCQEFCVMVY